MMKRPCFSLRAVRACRLPYWYVGRFVAKQSRQYTGLSPRGWNGTSAFWPHALHVTLNISRVPPPPYVPREAPKPPPPPPPLVALRAVRQSGQRLGLF